MPLSDPDELDYGPLDDEVQKYWNHLIAGSPTTKKAKWHDNLPTDAVGEIAPGEYE